MKRDVIRVDPLSTYLENWKAPTSAVTLSGDTIYAKYFPKDRPLGSLSAFPHGRDRSMSKWIASAFERTPPSKTAMAS